MSIEQSINNLVENQNKLMKHFDTNESRWNDSVDTLINTKTIEFNNIIQSGFLKNIHVNSLTGSDLNNGVDGSPMKSIKAAIDSIPNGGQGNIHLMPGQNFLITENKL